MNIQNGKLIISKNLSYLMEQKGINATSICKVLNIKQNTFSDWINQKTFPRIEVLEKLAFFFNVSLSKLLDENLSEKKKLFRFDIWDGAKGIVVASSEDNAFSKLKTAFGDDLIVYEYGEASLCETGSCYVDYICDLDTLTDCEKYFNSISVFEF